MVKSCTTCGLPKTLALFYRDKTRPDGRASRCRKCVTDANAVNASNIKQARTDRRKDNPERTLLIAAKARAKLKKIACAIEVSDIFIPEFCPILGVKLESGRGKGSKGSLPWSPSLDRIIPALGYIPGNVQVISKRANTMKHNASFEELVLLGEWAKRQVIDG